MIAFVRGKICSIEENKVIVDTGSLGYEIFMPSSHIGALSPLHEEVQIFTYLHVREDEMSLFGFMDSESLRMFKMLLGVSGIGPKAGIGILSAFSVEDLKLAILSEDKKAISKAPGIGSKTAERMIIELRDKVSDIGNVQRGTDLGKSVEDTPNISALQEASEALQVLGFSASEVYRVLRSLDYQNMSDEELVKAGLKLLGRF